MYRWEEYVSYYDGGNYANGVCYKGASDGVTGLSYADGTKVNCNDIECRVGSTLEHATEATGKAVGAKVFHGVDHHASGTASAEGLHECGGEGRDNVVSDSDKAEQR